MTEQGDRPMEARLEAIERQITLLANQFERFTNGFPDLSPIADPPPDDIVRRRIQDIVLRNPGWITDPPPEDFLNVRILDLIRRYRGGFTDPAPDDLANVRLRDLLQRIPGGGVSDPSPEDLSRLTRVELESHIHRINAEMIRLQSMERLMTERLDEIGKQG
jgi:hypothetical protein